MISILISLGLAVLLWRGLSFDLLLSWLVSINLVAFLTYGFDKIQARRHSRRVTERTLLLLALIGGSIGALLGMQIFRHKTIKASFRRRFWLVIAAQAALIAAYYLIIV